MVGQNLPSHITESDVKEIAELITPVIMAEVLASPLIGKIKAQAIAEYVWENYTRNCDLNTRIHGKWCECWGPLTDQEKEQRKTDSIIHHMKILLRS